MKTSVIVRIVIWSVVALLLVSILVVGLSGVFPGFNFSNWFRGTRMSGSTGERYTAGGGSVLAADISEIDIGWVDGSVEIIESADVDQITFSETANRQLEEEYQMQYAVNNGRLTIRFSQEYVGWSLFNNWFVDKHLTVEIPAGKEFSRLRIDTTSAPLNAGGLLADDIVLSTVSGEIRLESSICDELRLNGVSGALRAEGIQASRVVSENVSGRTEIEGIFESVHSNSVSGSIKLESGSELKEVDAETVSGSIQLTIPEMDGFTARYSSVSGGFRCNGFAVEVANKRAIYKNGAADIEFDTVSGSMSIDKK